MNSQEEKLMTDTLALHIVSGIIATLVMSVCVLPPDMAKTRLQKMRIKNGVPEYNGLLDVWIKIIKAENVFSLWKGFTPFFLKTMPYSLILMVVYEDVLLENYKRFFMHKED